MAKLPALLALLLAAPAAALSGSDSVEKIEAQFDRYQALVAAGGPLSPKDKNEAGQILDALEKRFRMPTFMVKPHYTHDPANADETDVVNQVRFMKHLAGNMVKTLGEPLSFRSSYSASQKEGIRAGYMSERETMLKLFARMREALKARSVVSSPMPVRPAAAKTQAGAAAPAAPGGEPAKPAKKYAGSISGEGAVPLFR